MKMRRLIRLGLPLLGLGTVVLLAARIRGTSEAAPVTPAPAAAQERILAEGRIVAYPGAEVVVGTEVGGVLTEVRAREKQTVRRGEALAALRADDLRAQLAEARARILEASADTALYAAEYARIALLLADRVETQQNIERARRNLDAAAARLAVAEAAAARLDAEISKMRIVSPINGTVLARDVEPGETVASGDPLFTIADLTRTRIEAEIDEFDAGHVQSGSPVLIRAEGFEGEAWKGSVEEIPDRVVPRRTKPQDPGRPGDTRVLMVKIALDGPTPLKLGQRVEVEIARSRPPA